MEQTIDLRPYLAALGRFLWLIVGALLLAGAVSIAIYLSSGNYEATTLLTIPEPVQQAEFDARLTSTVRPTQALTQYPELARSEELLSRLAVKAEALSAGRITTATQLRAMTKVTTSADNRLMRLIVTDKDPDLATQLANLWADEFIAVIERLYGRGGADYFNDQLAQADTALQTANDALVAFQATNRQGIVDNELAALIARQQSLLADVNRYEAVLADIATLRTQLENNTSDAVTLADQLAALTVQLRAFEESLATPVAPQFQLNIGADTQLSASQRADQLQQLDALRVSIEAALATSRTQQEALAAPIFALQTEKQQLFNEGERLLRAREVAQDTYVIVARKIDEERVASRETVIRVASRALVPDKPARPSLVALVSLLAIVALIPTIAFILFWTWWRRPARRAAS